MERADVVVVGGGIVGLATAYRLLKRRPDLTVTVLEKEDGLGRHQTGHNSGVLHAGVYYAPGSLKARFCAAGKVQLERFAVEHGIPVVHNGKLVIAVDDGELGRLAELERRARANGVPDLEVVDAHGIRTIEPHATGVRALHSPRTAVVDFLAVTVALADEVRRRGGAIETGCEVADLRPDGPTVTVMTSTGDRTAGVVVTCAGLQADRMAATTVDVDDLAIVPFRGGYLELRPKARELVRGHVYPVPDPRYPFLGVHLSRRHDGQVWIGPNAVLAGARERYERWAFDRADVRAMLRFPGTWRMAARNIGAGVKEVSDDLLRRRYVDQVRRYVPEVRDEDVIEGPVGVRAQLVRRDGSLVDDFEIRESPGVVHLLNAPSPAATSSLAIGGHLAGLVEAQLAR